MPKFSITTLFVLTFWIAATIASISLIYKASNVARPIVIEVITASFSFATFGFAIYALFSSIFGSTSARPMWVGCAIVCWLLILVEPMANFGFSSICTSLVDWFEQTKAEDSIPRLDLYLYERSDAVAKVWRSSWIPILGCAGGFLAQSIANENKREQES